MTAPAPSSHTTVPARGARALRIAAGQGVRIVDPQGGQVGDLFVFLAADPGESLSAAHTRAHVDRLFPRVGQQFVTDRRRPLLTLIEDASPGRHDMLIPACDPPRYRALGVRGEHASCAENLRAAARTAGIRPAHVPQPVNVFMDIRPDSQGELTWHPAATAPGDSITFRAEQDCVVVLSACPQDLVDINRGVPTPLGLELLGPPE